MKCYVCYGEKEISDLSNGGCKRCPHCKGTGEEPEGIKMTNRLNKAKELLDVQGNHGTWDYDPYFHGMFNGMALIIAVMEDKEPEYKEAPERWGKDQPDVKTPLKGRR
jgi:hypothetical protein